MRASPTSTAMPVGSVAPNVARPLVAARSPSVRNNGAPSLLGTSRTFAWLASHAVASLVSASAPSPTTRTRTTNAAVEGSA